LADTEYQERSEVSSGFGGIIAVAFLVLEIVGITLMAGEIGLFITLLWLVADLFIGGWLIRSAGVHFASELMQATAQGKTPFSTLWTVGRRFVAGALFIMPGFISDAIALALLLSAGWPRAKANSAGPIPENHYRQYGGARTDAGNQGRGDGRGESGGESRGDIIEGEFRRED
jgi:UPF0716 protein FxsA